ncbi:MAG: hypothetical protein JWL64_577 [Frankiales bacterium]|nr:hypothetical protein [Frankiales bacterium]
MTTIEERLQRLEDRQEIQQLFVDYGRHLDRGDWDAYAALFAEDGEILLGAWRARGRDAIREVMKGALQDSVGSTFHVISSPDVRLAGDVATSEVMWTVIARDPEGAPGLTMVGRHVDELRRIEGRWRIVRRKGYVDLPAPTRG